MDIGPEINLDILFESQLTTDNSVHVLEGTPEGGNNDTVALNSFSRIKLAANPNMYHGHTLHDFYSFGGWDAGSFHRTEYRGPLVEGPHAYMFEQGTMLTAHAQPDEIAYLIEEGTILIFMGARFVVNFPAGRRGKFPELTLVSETVAA
jgi:hypothetical protein